ncbi:Oidioi.mRNA.OKI2018_I69.chr1.g1717.t1.cds [Oikopleura dioica]|uniref:Oidioi.mRNA.OKI2018_I69.chr1.g1717.t1.cds n=1 Tax=Oikopleura dioica TaxID=34765 RepID=A0ABN7SP98_OIKDI|nr:Oidioi.mRNA.OKI2018_I69.chr1.g1717.t1.cds [Oikopleura dioica]
MKLFSSFFLFALENEARKPNVILLNVDDFGIGDFSIYNREAKVPTPNIDRIGEPHIGEMFKKSGYKTGIFGKQQPFPMGINHENATREDNEATTARRLEALEYKKEVGLLNFPNTATVHQKFGYYAQNPKPEVYGYDYAYTQPGLCCSPGLSFENGRSTEPADTLIQLQPYPETTPVENYSPSGHNFPYTGYFGPTGHAEEITDPFQLNNYYLTWMRQTIAGKSFDSREIEQKTSKNSKISSTKITKSRFSPITE